MPRSSRTFVRTDELGGRARVVINRAGIGDERVEAYCTEEEIPILMRIPLDRRMERA